jgi:N-acetylglutamate synthase-like GNAT family acetyltransferase/SAM-dependent methyltransferase
METRAVLRAAAGGDAGAVERLLGRVGLPALGLSDQFTNGYTVAESAGDIVGAGGVEVHGEDGLLRSVVVDSGHRGTGLGRAIVEDRLAWARARGLRALYLLTETAPGFFERHGFERIARAELPAPVAASREASEACPESAVAMRRAIAPFDARHTEAVRDHYARAARTSGCGCDCGCGEGNPVTDDLYRREEVDDLPASARDASLGCGNPTALAELLPGEVVLDLGSGGGLDVLLSARRVGPTGKAYGLDMTDEMLALARENQRRAGVANVEFLKGHIEEIPLPESAVDVVISNCVINLSSNKPRVLREAHRVLRPHGRLAVSDIVARGPVPEAVARNAAMVLGCIGGALTEDAYRAHLAEAGFVDIEVEPTRIYHASDLRVLAGGDPELARAVEAADGHFMSAFVRARKPERAA